jgi:Tol biopolymer transport system component
LHNLTPQTAPHRWLRWSPDGKYIAFEKNHSVWVAEVKNRQ